MVKTGDRNGKAGPRGSIGASYFFFVTGLASLLGLRARELGMALRVVSATERAPTAARRLPLYPPRGA